MKRILVIGSLNVDCVVHVDHVPVTGETILCSKMNMIPGGKGANQACAAGKLGAAVTLLGAVGEDAYAKMQKESLIQAGVDISALAVRKDIRTGFAFISVNKEGDNCIVVIQGANATLSKEDIDKNAELIRKNDIVIFQLEVPLSTVLYGAKKAKEMGKMVILDPAPVPLDFPEELYQYVDIIKPNETELGMLTGIDDIKAHLEEAASCLRAKGIRDVVVTLGGKGVYIDSEKDGRCLIPAIKTPIVDTTAAGDSFVAALALMTAEGKTITESAVFANYAASIVVSREGAQTSIPNRKEVQDLIQKLAPLQS